MAEARNSPIHSNAESPRNARGISHTLRYFSRFGLKGGMQAARVHRPSSQPISVRLPRLAHPLWVRPGSADAATFDAVFVAHEYALPLGDFAPRHILDLGANVGFASVLFATRWPDAAILAVEPEPRNVGLLERNTGAYPKINALHAAVFGVMNFEAAKRAISRQGYVVYTSPGVLKNCS